MFWRQQHCMCYITSALRAKRPSRVSLTVCDTLAFPLFFTLMCHLVSNYLTCPERKQITTLSDGLSTVWLNQRESMSAKISKDKRRAQVHAKATFTLSGFWAEHEKTLNVVRFRPCSPAGKGSAPLPHATLCYMSHYISSTLELL